MSDALASDSAMNDRAARSSWDDLSWIEPRRNSDSAFGRPAHRSQEIWVEPPPVVIVRVERAIEHLESGKPISEKSGLPSYPKWLINVFAVGSIVTVIGVLLLVAAALTKIKAIDAAGGIAAAIGTVSVALAVLRGQDIGGRV
jgi:hypothetical protein